MDMYLGGTEVTSHIVLADDFGNPLTVDTLEYEVVDQTGAAVVAREPIAGFVAGTANVLIVVPPSANTLTPPNVRESRRINLYCIVAGNTLLITRLYAVEANAVLVTGENSFQTYDEAELLSLEIPNVNGWNAATYRDKIAALMEARVRLCKMNFNIFNSNMWAGGMGYGGDISYIPPESFVQLPPRFLKALRLAQVAEANYITGIANGQIVDKQAQGLVEDTVGESKQVFSRGMPLKLQVSRDASRYLSTYITYNIRTARA
jgi:hypothetical protein